jgi:hypothetical protein
MIWKRRLSNSNDVPLLLPTSLAEQIEIDAARRPSILDTNFQPAEQATA